MSHEIELSNLCLPGMTAQKNIMKTLPAVKDTFIRAVRIHTDPIAFRDPCPEKWKETVLTKKIPEALISKVSGKLPR